MNEATVGQPPRPIKANSALSANNDEMKGDIAF